MTSPLTRHLRMIADGIEDQHKAGDVRHAADLLDQQRDPAQGKSDADDLIEKWRTQARQHDEAADECFERGDDDEGDMNHVEATSLRRCADELAALRSPAGIGALVGPPGYIERDFKAAYVKMKERALEAEAERDRLATLVEGVWRRMDTIPRDGTPFLYHDQKCAIPETVCYLNGSKIVKHGLYPYAGGNWFVAEGEWPDDARWMPMPSLPSTDRTHD